MACISREGFFCFMCDLGGNLYVEKRQFMTTWR